MLYKLALRKLAAIRDRMLDTPDSLPVLTLANVERIRRDRQYAAEVSDRLLDFLFSIEEFLGDGRLFLP